MRKPTNQKKPKHAPQKSAKTIEKNQKNQKNQGLQDNQGSKTTYSPMSICFAGSLVFLVFLKWILRPVLS